MLPHIRMQVISLNVYHTVQNDGPLSLTEYSFGILPTFVPAAAELVDLDLEAVVLPPAALCVKGKCSQQLVYCHLVVEEELLELA